LHNVRKLFTLGDEDLGETAAASAIELGHSRRVEHGSVAGGLGDGGTEQVAPSACGARRGWRLRSRYAKIP